MVLFIVFLNIYVFHCSFFNSGETMTFSFKVLVSGKFELNMCLKIWLGGGSPVVGAFSTVSC